MLLACAPKTFGTDTGPAMCYPQRVDSTYWMAIMLTTMPLSVPVSIAPSQMPEHENLPVWSRMNPDAIHPTATSELLTQVTCAPLSLTQFTVFSAPAENCADARSDCTVTSMSDAHSAVCATPARITRLPMIGRL